ncbi:3,9-dihydroxypterocarpan 6A-monooxygenase [Quercus suber]|uniref:3,9-dihydroxypterocarpan 6A-monooxygenase n=1 Tax=Quercus suber TaxID=58331 RepID=A0AAW0LGA9_QUESU
MPQEINFISRPELGSFDYSIYKGHILSRLIMASWSPQLNHTIDIREEEVEKLMEKIIKISREGKACDLSSELTTLTNNIICRMAMSTRCSGSENDAEEIDALVKLKVFGVGREAKYR